MGETFSGGSMGLFSTLATVAGSIIGGPELGKTAGSLVGGIEANKANKQAAQTQMDFQQENSNTSYQRAVKDMEAAGLNPMLAYSQGGASTPSGSTYSAQDVVTPAAKLGNETNSANSAIALQKSQILNTNSSTALNTANVLKSRADAALSTAQAASVTADIPAKDVRSQLWRILQPTASSAADAARGINYLYPEKSTRKPVVTNGHFTDGPSIDDLKNLIQNR